MVFIMLRYISSKPTLLRVFIMNGCCTLSNAFSASIERVMCVCVFLKILFIYLTERDSQREGTQAGGVGEKEAVSQRRSLMWALIPEHWDHALGQRQMLNNWAPQPPLCQSFLPQFVCVWVCLCGVCLSVYHKKTSSTVWWLWSWKTIWDWSTTILLRHNMLAFTHWWYSFWRTFPPLSLT